MTLTTITGSNKVYGAYDDTICFEKSYFTIEEYETAIQEARALLFGYGLSSMNVTLRNKEDLSILTKEDVFKLLPKF